MILGTFVNPKHEGRETAAKSVCILVCDFGHTPEGWAYGLDSLCKKSKSELYDGDIMIIGGVGEDMVYLESGAFPLCFIKFSSRSSSRFGPNDRKTLAQALVPRNLQVLADYERIEIVAMGLGVRYAAFMLNHFPEEWFKTKSIRGIALGGTVTAVDDERGMPRALWTTTLDKMTVGSLEQYYLNLFNSSKYYFNLRFAPINIADKEPRKNQSELPKLTDFKKRLEEVATFHLGKDYAKVATTVCYQSARPRMFQKPKGMAKSFMSMSSKLTTPGMMAISGDLCFAPAIPLGELGRSRFDQCFKLHYAYTKDILCPAAAIPADLAAADSKAEVRELDSPHFNCEQVCQLLLEPNHPDWED